MKENLLSPYSLTRQFSLENVGAEEHQVGELKNASDTSYIESKALATLIFEFEAYPEPKSLKPSQLRQLLNKYGNGIKVSKIIGSCEAFVRQNSREY